ncbi:hypothetical protein, partial [Terribacillus saccharophilus]|uniref:hypothetical protein n=1 Tax=Terribacillus saccharophilus TaxID=361277 RepID=UPI002DC58827|nr:hypothetical protein [Terribacillus saccharophilus]
MSIHKLKIGILTTTISNFGSTGFYNSQDIGLARKLRDNVEFVNIYKLISNKGKRLSEPLFPNVRVNYIPSRNIGVNGILDIKELDTDLDVLIYFSDTQLSLPRINKWCLRNSIKLLPYIGTMKSNSKNPLIRKVNNLISLRNANIYKGLTCIVKTSQV